MRAALLAVAVAGLLAVVPCATAQTADQPVLYHADMVWEQGPGNQLAKGWSELQYFAGNKSAYILVEIYNLTDGFIASHLHLQNDKGSPIIIWLDPHAMAGSSDETFFGDSGSKFEGVVPWNGYFSYATWFNESYINPDQALGLTNWATFQTALERGRIYVNAHTVDNKSLGLALKGTFVPGPRNSTENVVPMLPAPAAIESSDAVANYRTEMVPLAVVESSNASGYFSLTTFQNHTAHASIVLNNITDFIAAHIHDETGVPSVWLQPATANSTLQTFFSLTVYSAVLPISGSFYWELDFDSSLFSFSKATTWAEFEQGLASGKYYVNIHTLANPGGEIRGNITQVAMPPAAALNSPPMPRPLLLSPVLGSPELQSPPQSIINPPTSST